MIFAFDVIQDADTVIDKLNNLGIQWDIDEFEQSDAVILTYNTTVKKVVEEICDINNILYDIITL